MVYCLSDLSSIKSKLTDKFMHYVDRCNEDGTIDDLMSEWGVAFNERMPICSRTAVILVIGELAGNKSDYIKVAKKYSITDRQLEFVSYTEAKQLNAARLEFSNIYSDIICGPMPHKLPGMKDTSSLIAKMKNNPSSYPNILLAENNDSSSTLKITISNFLKLIAQSYLYDSLTAI